MKPGLCESHGRRDMSKLIPTAEYKLLAMDLDGTVLDRRGTPHPQDVEAIRSLSRAGVIVSVITGRLYSKARAIVADLGLTGPIACMDGAHIVDTSEETTLVHHVLRGPPAALVRESLARHDLATLLMLRDSIVYDHRTEPYLGPLRHRADQWVSCASTIAPELWRQAEGVTTVLAIGDADRVAAARDEVECVFGRETVLGSFPLQRLPGSWCLVVRAAGASKGAAIGFLADYYSISLAQTVCVGDWRNDISMFSLAGCPVAMGHAPPEVKRAARIVLEETAVTGGGIARIASRLFGVAT
jgi:Cof subfamily protein (haloacid dehalogenase superfamily)